MSQSTLCVFSCEEFKGNYLCACTMWFRQKKGLHTDSGMCEPVSQDTEGELAPKFRDPELKNKKDWQPSPSPPRLCWEPGCGDAPSSRGKSLLFVPTAGDWQRFNRLSLPPVTLPAGLTYRLKDSLCDTWLRWCKEQVPWKETGRLSQCLRLFGTEGPTRI